jgi:hypothetical protein
MEYPLEKTIVQGMKSLKPEIHALLMGPAETAGQILNAPLQIANAPLGFAVRRMQQVIRKLDDWAEGNPGAFAKAIPDERRERIWRTIYSSAQSAGTEMLDYWTKLIGFQVYATERELDLSEALVSALKSMTDTHGRFLKAFGDVFEYRDEACLLDDAALRNTGMENQTLEQKLEGYAKSEVQILLSDLVALGLVCSLGMTTRRTWGIRPRVSVHSREGHFYCLTRKGVELLRLGEWKPRINEHAFSEAEMAISENRRADDDITGSLGIALVE